MYRSPQDQTHIRVPNCVPNFLLFLRKEKGRYRMIQKLKVNLPCNLPWRHRGGVQVQLYFFSWTSALDGGEWLTPCSGRFTLKNDPAPIVQEAVWAPGSVWTDAENLGTPPGIRFPDRPAHSESLHRLSYSGPRMIRKQCIKFRGYKNEVILNKRTLLTWVQFRKRRTTLQFQTTKL
jgi:hypothetical protein